MSDSLWRLRVVRRCGLAILAAAAVTCGGCNAIEAMRSLIYHAQPEKEKVDAEYAGLNGHKALVYVWAKP
jgi:hypothetical protein